MRITEGEILKNKMTYDFHMVMKIDGTRVFLENGIGSVRISLELKDLELYYHKIKVSGARCFV